MTYKFPTLPVDVARLLSLDSDAQGGPYVWNGKPSVGHTANRVRETGADCSGYVGWLLSRSTFPAVRWAGIGTSTILSRCIAAKLKRSTTAAGLLHDGALRLAVAVAGGGIGKIGHVVLIHNGVTLESHGGGGIDNRTWTGKGWQRFAVVFVVTPPIDKED